MTEKRDKVNVDDIIGLIKTDEPTNSVEEVRKLRGRETEKRFTYDKPLVAFSKGGINDNVTGETYEFTIDTVLDLLNELHEENRRLKSQLCYNGSDVCDICKHQYLVKSENYYIAKCEKGHDECSKDYLKYCTDFDIKVKE